MCGVFLNCAVAKFTFFTDVFTYATQLQSTQKWEDRTWWLPAHCGGKTWWVTAPRPAGRRTVEDRLQILFISAKKK